MKILIVLFFCLCVKAQQNETQETGKLCQPGINIGYMLIRKPNITSMLTIGIPYNVSWDYTTAVKKEPVFINVYIQLIASGIPVTWKNQIFSNQTATPRWFIWTPDKLVNGKYKIRIVPDGKENYNIPANLQPCFENGESLPSVSAAFTLSNPSGTNIDVSVDKYPPYSKGHKLTVFTFYYCIIVIICLHYLIL